MHKVEGLLGFVLAGLALAGSPGPANLSLAAAGAAFGARRALAYMAGIVAGMVAVMAISATGLTAVLLAVPGVAPVVGVLAAAYFAYLAFRIATAPPLTDAGPQHRQPSFAGGAFLSLVNPKGYAAMAALFSGFVLAPESPEADVAAKILVLATIIVAVTLAWLLGGAALTRVFQTPVANRAVNLTFAALLLASVVFALLLQ